MQDQPRDPADYREMARRVRRVAGRCDYPEIAAELLSVAVSFDRLATYAESQRRQSKTTKAA